MHVQTTLKGFTDMQNKILKLPTVIERTGLSRSSIYSFIHDNRFPAPIKLGERSVGWIEENINSWISERAKASVGGAA